MIANHPTIRTMYIYDFPEIRPGIYVCNTDWLIEGRTILQRITTMKGVQQILIQPWMGSWETCLNYLKTKTELPIYQLDESNLTTGSLVIYDPSSKNSVVAFEKEFGCSLSRDGSIIGISHQ